MTGSPFTAILEQTVRALPGARGAIFVDWEGEDVGFFALPGEPEIQLVGAHWGVIYNLVKDALIRLELGAPEDLVLRFDHQQLIVTRVTDDYIAMMTLEPDANLGRALRLLQLARLRLRQEM